MLNFLGRWQFTLDAMELHIAMYLLWNLRVPASSIPALVPMIDTRWFEARLESEVADVLKKLEDGAEREYGRRTNHERRLLPSDDILFYALDS